MPKLDQILHFYLCLWYKGKTDGIDSGCGHKGVNPARLLGSRWKLLQIYTHLRIWPRSTKFVGNAYLFMLARVSSQYLNTF